MFPNHHIDAITNGVHAATWTSPPLRALFDRYVPDWRQDNYSLRQALRIPSQELWAAHQVAKGRLFQHVQRTQQVALDPDVFTIGFARRVATYKRADLFFHDVERVRRLHAEAGRIQLVFAGKAHPHDGGGKELIRRLYQSAAAVESDIRFVYLENYDMEIGALITAGVDVWLNNPEAPLEASGTSGMKAALNGVPSLSILDGWWVEGCVEGVTGWAIGQDDFARGVKADRARDAHLTYDKLEYVVLPAYYHDRERYLDIMRHAIAINGAFFNTQRMMQQYVQRVYTAH
jgi:starch phosphorylase